MRHAPHQPEPDVGFVEVADRVWVSRRGWYDVNLTAVGGERGTVLIDTHGSEAAGRAVLDDLAAQGIGPVVAVVNTHAHHDHVLGNAALRSSYPDVPVIAHEAALAEIEEWDRDPAGLPLDAPRREEVLASRVTVPDTTFSSVHVIDLGDRAVELVHPGPAHTGGDLVARVTDPAGTADVLVVGDLVEESDVPSYGPDSHPLSWPLALDLVIGLTGPDTVVVPGHGRLVGRELVEEQRNDIGTVAETVRDLVDRGVPLDDALGAASWPYPAERLAHAVARGYDALPRARRRLPLV
ncbi:MBL fold metallo-hydrolase [Marmoricola endophyticus]|uniref:MBL fold metallo-hydrolase n=1 Tax=Marmoricola endophyticus TaxID=2040280 RepID=A0A917EXN0_9ACTN|nr:MBL fold metallo-hydrolase [Marmoricola endophyticus]GGF31706.1 MBL fold metallo-hydrolase [Marmoricola endophyticus]